MSDHEDLHVIETPSDAPRFFDCENIEPNVVYRFDEAEYLSWIQWQESNNELTKNAIPSGLDFNSNEFASTLIKLRAGMFLVDDRPNLRKPLSKKERNIFQNMLDMSLDEIRSLQLPMRALHCEKGNEHIFRKLIKIDYSDGLEEYPIRVFGKATTSKETAESAKIPELYNFLKYRAKNYFSQRLKDGCKKSKSRKFRVCCSCSPESGCLLNSACECRKAARKFGDAQLDSREGRVYLRENSCVDSTVLISCGPMCGCQDKDQPSICSNELLTHLSQGGYPVELFARDDFVGFGVRTLSAIKPGSIVVEFQGEVLSDAKLDALAVTNPRSLTYCMMLFSKDKKSHTWEMFEKAKSLYGPSYKLPTCGFQVDPSLSGNYAQFVNHSCDPNLIPMVFAANDLRPKSMTLVLVAVSPIPPGAELTFDYGYTYIKANLPECCCGAMTCWRSPRISEIRRRLTITEKETYVSKSLEKQQKICDEIDAKLRRDVASFEKFISAKERVRRHTPVTDAVAIKVENNDTEEDESDDDNDDDECVHLVTIGSRPLPFQNVKEEPIDDYPEEKVVEDSETSSTSTAASDADADEEERSPLDSSSDAIQAEDNSNDSTDTDARAKRRRSGSFTVQAERRETNAKVDSACSSQVDDSSPPVEEGLYGPNATSLAGRRKEDAARTRDGITRGMSLSRSKPKKAATNLRRVRSSSAAQVQENSEETIRRYVESLTLSDLRKLLRIGRSSGVEPADVIKELEKRESEKILDISFRDVPNDSDSPEPEESEWQAENATARNCDAPPVTRPPTDILFKGETVSSDWPEENEQEWDYDNDSTWSNHRNDTNGVEQPSRAYSSESAASSVVLIDEAVNSSCRSSEHLTPSSSRAVSNAEWNDLPPPSPWNAGQRDYNEEPDYNEDRDWNSHRRLGKPRDFNEERDWDNHRRFSAPCPNNDRYDQPSASNWNTETRSRDPREQQPSYGVAQPSPPQRFWAPTPQNLSPGMFSYPPPSPAMMPPGFPAPSFAPSPAYAYGRQGEFDHANRHHQHDAGPSSLHQPPPAQNFRDVRAMPSTLLPYEGHRRRTREDDYLDDGPTFSREPRWEAPSSSSYDVDRDRNDFHRDYDRNRDERRDDWERQSSSSAPQRHYSSHAASDSPLRKRHRQRNDDKWSSNNGTSSRVPLEDEIVTLDSDEEPAGPSRAESTTPHRVPLHSETSQGEKLFRLMMAVQKQFTPTNREVYYNNSQSISKRRRK